ncbi:hypothetical protein FRC04_003759, partial [Tulasnella sp. 424]
IKHLLSHQSSDRPLEDRQITNLINQSQEEAREAVSALGGDAAALVACLKSLRQQDNRWEIWTWVAEDGRNQYGYPLNIGIIVKAPHLNPKSMWEATFAPVIKLLEEYAGPFALHTAWEEMERCLNYTAELVEIPGGSLQDWAKAFEKDNSGFDWIGGEECRMINHHSNDSASISIPWLQVIQFLFHGGQSSSRHLVLLDHDRYLCDCCMGTNLGLPCCHYFAVLHVMVGLSIHSPLTLVQSRWHQNPNLDTSKIPPVTLEHIAHEQHIQLPSHQVSNPLEPSLAVQATPPAT